MDILPAPESRWLARKKTYHRRPTRWVGHHSARGPEVPQAGRPPTRLVKEPLLGSCYAIRPCWPPPLSIRHIPQYLRKQSDRLTARVMENTLQNTDPV